MGQIADAVQLHGGGSGTGSGPDTGKLACSPFWQGRSQFQASMPRNPFTDSHAISTLTDMTVGDLDRIEMSTYQDKDTGGRLYISHSTTKQTDYRPEAAVVLDVVAGDKSVQHIVASFPAEAFSGVRTEGGKRSTTSY